MVRQRRAARLAGARLVVGSLLGALLLVAAPGLAFAETPTTRLAISAVGQQGSFFDLKMAPGRHKSLEVILSNDGTDTVAARTYAADVYTIANGGFGGRLYDEPQTGTTSWLDYPAEALRLGAGDRTRRWFAVDVPADARPGEYITSLVLEHAVPPKVGAAVEINQVVRQAIAVVVTVPGPRMPAISIGGAHHDVVAGKSIVSIAVSNTGNVRLKPLIEFTLADAAGATVSHSSVEMDSFYAQTATTVEVPLTALLLPGRYTVRFIIGDATQKLAVREASIAFTVEATPTADPVVGAGTGLTDLTQGFGEDPTIVWAVVVAGLLGLGIVLVAIAFAVRQRRTRGA